MSCIATTPHHVLTGSQDSNIHVWTLSRLLEINATNGGSPTDDLEPDLTLSNHRGAITALAIGASTNPDTSVCVSASADKSCILWNYRTGTALRTLLFPSAPLCLSLDPCSRSICVCCEDASLFLVELAGSSDVDGNERTPPLVGPHSRELASTVVQVTSPLGAADPDDAGPASCVALTHDGTAVLTGHSRGKILRWQLVGSAHPTELTDLNAAVTNIIFPPLQQLSSMPATKPVAIVKPSLAEREYTFSAQLATDLGDETVLQDGGYVKDSRFERMLNGDGLPDDVLEKAIMAFSEPPPATATPQRVEQDQPAEGISVEAQKQIDELQAIIAEQRALQKELQK